MEKKQNSVNRIPFKFDGRYVLSDTSTRITRLANDEKCVGNLIMSTQLPYVFTDEPIPLNFNYSLSETIAKESYSKISWLLTHPNVHSPILIYFNLTENTLEITVLLIFEIEIVKRELISENYVDKIISTFPEICVEMIKNIGKELEEDNKDIYHYESKVLKYSREKIWEIVTNFHFLMCKKGVIKNCSMDAPINKAGSEFSFYVNCNNKKKLCRLKVNKYKKDEVCNKWEVGYSPLEGPFQHSENFWTLIRLKDNETLVGNTTKYSEHIEPEVLQNLTEEKIKAFDAIEKLIENKEKEDNQNAHDKNSINTNCCEIKNSSNENNI